MRVLCLPTYNAPFEKICKQGFALKQDWQNQVDASAAEAEMYELRADRASQQVNAIRTAVADLFEVADCRLLDAQEVLATGPVDANNLMQYLGIIEQRVDQNLRVGSSFCEIHYTVKTRQEGFLEGGNCP